MKDIVVITGASGGLGRRLVEEYLRKGNKVLALDHNEVQLQQMKTALRSDLLIPVVVDLSLLSSLEPLVNQICHEHGVPFIWINNAGTVELGRFLEVTSEAFQKVMDVNFNAIVVLSRAIMKQMNEAHRGIVANVSSVNGVVPAPFMSAYVASKHAVVGFTRSLQLELQQNHSPLHVSLVLPGFVDTPIMQPRAGFAFPKWLKWMVATPETTAREIVKGIARRDDEIAPTANGRMLLRWYRMTPGLTARLTRMLTAKNWKQLLDLEPVD